MTAWEYRPRNFKTMEVWENLTVCLPASNDCNLLTSSLDTSKIDCKGPTYGRHGSFLASLAALSLVTITSHHHQHHSQNTLSVNRSQVIARRCPAPYQQ